MTTQRFEDRLSNHLRRVVAERPAPAATRHRARRTRLTLAGVGVAAATAAVAIVAATGDVTPSAYAVQASTDGTVTVTIHSLSDAAGLQSSLRAAGVPAVVDYVPAGQAGCVQPPPGGPGSPPRVVTGSRPAGAQGELHQAAGAGSAGPSLQTSTVESDTTVGGNGSGPKPEPGAPGAISTRLLPNGDGVTFTIGAGSVRPGEQLYITTSTGAMTTIGMAIGTEKPSPDCGTN